MASSSTRPERVYHQDYIARVRYSNALPPPPNPPKLLDIPNTGLSGGQYTSAAYASRLAREQPLNIEADAELGMHIDLVGLPGVFDGDESVIHAPERPPPPHPHDKPLLRALSTLGKPTSATQGVSFLRRTEYITSAATSKNDVSSKEFIRPRPLKKRRHVEPSNDDPIHILRSIIKGFDLAYPNEAYTGPDSTENLRGAEITSEEKNAWKFPQHPSKPDVKLLDSYPILPDTTAFADALGYCVIKFASCPVSATDKYDSRLDVGLFRPLIDAQVQAEHDAQRALDASTPALKYDYEYFLPQPESVRGIKRKFNPNDLENDSEDLYDADTRQSEKPGFRFHKLRTYETFQQSGTSSLYSETVSLALHDPSADSKKPKGAYLYPITQRIFVRPRRVVNRSTASQVDEEGVDVLDITIRDPDEDEQEAKQNLIRAKYESNADA